MRLPWAVYGYVGNGKPDLSDFNAGVYITQKSAIALRAIVRTKV